ncbi:DNA-binding protein [Candidatus Babela massiliensis]|uniref:Predicted transcriptional regulator n=1 Tax=Candidatus Babela massiliensis TaxID=673862 RepID=V6DF21_9BACT|nr:transcriptional regulator [Candidatus Babela massiliensis]CDK30197.1 Predicted transcriptional regulator [Candidatus Babela massiliensis]
MDKTKTLKKQKPSSKNILIYKVKPDIKSEPYEVGEIVLQEGFLGKAIAECLINNDPEGVLEVISIFIDLLNKSQLAKDAGMNRSSLYRALKGNPTIKTVAKVLHSAVSSNK